MTEGVTEKARMGVLLDWRLSNEGGVGGKSPTYQTLRCDDEGFSPSCPTPRFQEKLLGLIMALPVPITDTGGRGENPKAIERTLVKELGKMTP